MKKTSDRKSQSSADLGEHGLALVVVLWIFIFLFVVAFDFSSAAREEGLATQRYGDESEGYYLAVAGFEEALYGLLKLPPATNQPPLLNNPALQPQELVDGEWHEKRFGSGSYSVRLVDESGKININRVDEETLKRIFINLGIDEPQRSLLVDSILDWRDADNLHRPNGAEDDYYLALSPGYTAKNGPLDMVEELLWVKGVTPDLFYGSQEDGRRKLGLRDIFTVDSPMDQVNLRTASAEVIQALMGLSPEKSQDFVEQRRKLSEKTIADLLKLLGIGEGDAATRRFVFTTPVVISIESAGRPSDSITQRQIRGVVRLGRGSAGFDLVRWIDRDTMETNR